MQTTTYVAVDESMLVPWYKRLLNFVIDISALCLLLVIFGLIAGIFAALGYPRLLEWATTMDGISDRVFTSGVLILYVFGMEATTQRTLGKYVTGTMVVMEDGSKPEPGAIIKRALCRIFLFEVLSFITRVPRGWHDTASDTFVVDVKKYKSACELSKSLAEIGAA